MGFDWDECWKAKHPKRLVQWRINNVTPSDHETEMMDDAGVAPVAEMRSLLVWRRTTFLAALPILLVSALLETVQTFDEDSFEGLSGLGKLLALFPPFGAWTMFGFCIAAVWKWKAWRDSSKLLKIGWAVSFALPLVPALFPLEYIIDSEIVEMVEEEGGELLALFESYKVFFAIAYVFQILPVVISFPGGSMRAALRMRALVPDSNLSCWILVISAPFYSVLILMGLVVVLQLAGNGLLIFGTLLLTVNPWVYVYFRRLLLTASTPEVERQLDLMQRCTGISNFVGFVLIIIYIITSPDIEEYMSPGEAVRFALVGWSRTVVTTIMFCDIFLRMTITNWKEDCARRNSDQAGRIDMLFQSLETCIKKKDPSTKEVVSEMCEPVTCEPVTVLALVAPQQITAEEVVPARGETTPDVEEGGGATRSPQKMMKEQAVPALNETRPDGEAGGRVVLASGARDQLAPRVQLDHPGVTCDHCKKEGFNGPRYQCQEVDDYDLCESCYRSENDGYLQCRFWRINKNDGPKMDQVPRREHPRVSVNPAPILTPANPVASVFTPGQTVRVTGLSSSSSQSNGRYGVVDKELSGGQKYVVNIPGQGKKIFAIDNLERVDEEGTETENLDFSVEVDLTQDGATGHDTTCPVGACVELKDLAAADDNGKFGIIEGQEKKGRIIVVRLMDDSRVLKVKKKNAIVLSEAY